MEAATNTLADALLDDLDDLSDVEEGEEEQQQQQQQAEAEVEARGDDADAAIEEEEPESSSAAAGAARTTTTTTQQANAAAAGGGYSLQQDAVLQRHLQEIRKSDESKQQKSMSSTSTTTSQQHAASADGGKEDEQREHRLIVSSNKLLAKLGNELSSAHGELCAAYKPKFPELEELLPNPLQYRSAVDAIDNEMDLSLVNDALNRFLTPNQVLTISVSGSTTSGRSLAVDELANVRAAIATMDEIVAVRDVLAAFVERRMENLAPNVCALLNSPALAAQLLGLAGGLEDLSKIPACNLQVLGQTKQTSSSRGGMSSATTRPNEGVLSACDLVRRCPRHLQKKALKTVAAKLALAVRCDLAGVGSGSSQKKRDAAAGHSFRNEIESKITKLEEPDKAPVLKALPKPDLTIKKRRGGKRIRRMKEKFEETALMKQANTRAFSTQAGEYGDDAMGLTMGLLDTTDVSAGGAGALRRRTEKKKMKYANTKASRKRSAQMNAQASNNPAASAASGLASSMVFTPVQGMELVNPEANRERVADANRNWFGDDAGFKSALQKK